MTLFILSLKCGSSLVFRPSPHSRKVPEKPWYEASVEVGWKLWYRESLVILRVVLAPDPPCTETILRVVYVWYTVDLTTSNIIIVKVCFLVPHSILYM